MSGSSLKARVGRACTPCGSGTLHINHTPSCNPLILSWEMGYGCIQPREEEVTWCLGSSRRRCRYRYHDTVNGPKACRDPRRVKEGPQPCPSSHVAHGQRLEGVSSRVEGVIGAQRSSALCSPSVLGPSNWPGAGGKALALLRSGRLLHPWIPPIHLPGWRLILTGR